MPEKRLPRSGRSRRQERDLPKGIPSRKTRPSRRAGSARGDFQRSCSSLTPRLDMASPVSGHPFPKSTQFSYFAGMAKQSTEMIPDCLPGNPSGLPSGTRIARFGRRFGRSPFRSAPRFAWARRQLETVGRRATRCSRKPPSEEVRTYPHPCAFGSGRGRRPAGADRRPFSQGVSAPRGSERRRFGTDRGSLHRCRRIPRGHRRSPSPRSPQSGPKTRTGSRRKPDGHRGR